MKYKSENAPGKSYDQTEQSPKTSKLYKTIKKNHQFSKSWISCNLAQNKVQEH